MAELILINKISLTFIVLSDNSLNIKVFIVYIEQYIYNVYIYITKLGQDRDSTVMAE